MRKLLAVLCGTALVSLAGPAVSQSTMKEEKKMETKDMATKEMGMKEMRMKGMDANNDGMVSKAEFLSYHEAMWNKMKRNQAGMAMMEDVEMMYAPGTVPSAIPGEPAKKAKP
jgi:hypothetical protein